MQGVPLWDQMEGAWLWTLISLLFWLWAPEVKVLARLEIRIECVKTTLIDDYQR